MKRDKQSRHERAMENNAVTTVRLLSAIERRLQMVENVLVYVNQPKRSANRTPKITASVSHANKPNTMRNKVIRDIYQSIEGISCREEVEISVNVKFSPQK